MTSGFDVLIVGAGPAGASLALRLAAAGLRIGLLDARAFPRSKPCGDAVSPGATPLLGELGVWDDLRPGRARSVMLRGWKIRSHDGSWFEGRFSPGLTGSPDRGLAIDRALFDDVLVRRARAAGADLLERTHALGLVLRNGRVVAATVRDGDGRERAIPARFVVGADGLRSRVARLLGSVRGGRRRRLGLVTRFEGPQPDAAWGELRLSAEGVLGWAPISRSACNVTLVVPAGLAREIQGDPAGFVRARLRAYGALERAGTGPPLRAVEVTGPFEARPTRRTAPGALLAGDAAGYFDPFTGQGVYRALLGARLAAAAIRRALEDPASEARALAGYERALDRELRPARALQRLLDHIVSRRAPMNASARLLRARPGLAARLVDATGDRLSPAELLGPRGWIEALAGWRDDPQPGPRTSTAERHAHP